MGHPATSADCKDASPSGGVELSWEGRTLTIRLADTRRRNALSPTMVGAIAVALDAAEREANLVVFRAAGPDFCSGFDLSDVEALSPGDLLLRLVRIEMLLARLWAASFTTVAVVQGRAFGAGADLFACCDIRVAETASRFRFPGSAFGLVLGARRLAERIGRDAARELHRSGRVLNANEAMHLGLATHLDASGALDAMVEGESRGSGRLDRETRSSIHRATATDLALLDADLAALVRSCARTDFHDRLVAYRQTTLTKKGATREDT